MLHSLNECNYLLTNELQNYLHYGFLDSMYFNIEICVRALK